MIYAPLLNKTVITGGITRTEIRKLIKSHNRILMMGHGNGGGLMSVGQFSEKGYPIIDDSMAGELSEKKDSICIWCDAGIKVPDFHTGYFEHVRNLQLVHPCLTGFGISNREAFSYACRYTSGDIIGSAFIRALPESGTLEEKTGNFITSIR
jgi:hypothetical protein